MGGGTGGSSAVARARYRSYRLFSCTLNQPSPKDASYPNQDADTLSPSPASALRLVRRRHDTLRGGAMHVILTPISQPSC